MILNFLVGDSVKGIIIMLVSVVVPCFNSESTIERTIKSVFNQTLLPYEIVCVDDGSSDRTIDLLLRLKDACPKGLSLIIIQQKNSGPSIARNVGVDCSKGNYIAFLDSDDVWHPKKIEIIANIVLKNNLNFIYHLYSSLPYTKEINFDNIEVKTKKRHLFALKNFIATPTVLLRKEFFCKFPEDLSYCEDYCCWLLSNENDFIYVDLPLANGFKNPLGESGLSSNIHKMHTGFLRALSYLHKEKKIGSSFYFIATIVEFIKYPIRYLR